MFGEIVYLICLLLIALRNYLSGISLLFPLALVTVFLITVLFREVSERKRCDFINQLKSQRKTLRSGGTVHVDGLLLRYDSVLTYYVLSIGNLFTNVIVPTQYRIHHGESHPEGMICAAFSFVTGWWSLTGPQTTLAIVLQNMRGGIRMPVSLLIDAALHDNEPLGDKSLALKI